MSKLMIKRLSLSKNGWFEVDNGGFTLVELSIVLVIIGLLIGGVLVAQSMISTAKFNKLIRTIAQYDIAAQNFYTKYSQLPGDSNRFSPAGNNDGKIYGYFQVYNNMTGLQLEHVNFWQHLNQSGDITNEQFSAYAGPGAFNGDLVGVVPDLKYGAGCVLNVFTFTIADSSASVDFGHAWAIYKPASGGNAACLTVAEALAIDIKLDNGLPDSGDTVRELYPYSGPYMGNHLGCNYNSDRYDANGEWNASTGTPESSLNPKRVECLLAIKAQVLRY